MRDRMGGMRFRKLRIAWSVSCIVACVLLIAFWMRSYWRSDDLKGQFLRLKLSALNHFAAGLFSSYLIIHRGMNSI
jgi:hypothetical protein